MAHCVNPDEEREAGVRTSDWEGGRYYEVTLPSSGRKVEVTVYYRPRFPAPGKPRFAEVSWPSLGAVPAEDPEAFAEALRMAGRYAREYPPLVEEAGGAENPRVSAAEARRRGEEWRRRQAGRMKRIRALGFNEAGWEDYTELLTQYADPRTAAIATREQAENTLLFIHDDPDPGVRVPGEFGEEIYEEVRSEFEDWQRRMLARADPHEADGGEENPGRRVPTLRGAPEDAWLDLLGSSKRAYLELERLSMGGFPTHETRAAIEMLGFAIQDAGRKPLDHALRYLRQHAALPAESNPHEGGEENPKYLSSRSAQRRALFERLEITIQDEDGLGSSIAEGDERVTLHLAGQASGALRYALDLGVVSEDEYIKALGAVEGIVDEAEHRNWSGAADHLRDLRNVVAMLRAAQSNPHEADGGEENPRFLVRYVERRGPTGGETEEEGRDREQVRRRFERRHPSLMVTDVRSAEDDEGAGNPRRPARGRIEAVDERTCLIGIARLRDLVAWTEEAGSDYGGYYRLAREFLDSVGMDIGRERLMALPSVPRGVTVAENPRRTTRERFEAEAQEEFDSIAEATGRIPDGVVGGLRELGEHLEEKEDDPGLINDVEELENRLAGAASEAQSAVRDFGEAHGFFARSRVAWLQAANPRRRR